MDLRASLVIPCSPETAWDTWVDAARYPQWQGGVLAVRELTGPASAVGTTYVLDHGPKMTRNVRVTAAERPVRHVIEQTGFGVHDVTTATFEPEAGGTRLTLTYYAHLNAVMRVLARLDRRSRMERELQAELARFATVVGRHAAAATAGRRYAVRAGAYRREVVVTLVDAGITHLRLLPGWCRWTDPAGTQLKHPSPVASDLRVWPIAPPLRAPLHVTQHGLPFLLRDGGHGVDHLALSAGPWADAEPSEIGGGEVLDVDLAAIAAWRAVDGPSVGRDATMSLAPLISLRLGHEADGTEVWDVAKVLRAEVLRVHLRVYGTRWPARPTDVAPDVLQLGRMSDAAMERGDPPDLSLGIGHVPLERGALGKADPRIVRLVTLTDEELDGWRYWRDEGAGSFSSLEPLLAWPSADPSHEGPQR